MPELRLTLAISHYAHTRELATGRVRPEGIELTVLNFPFEEVHFRFVQAFEWEICEFSLANYCAMVSRGPAPMVALPVFPSRMFRQSAIYVREDAGIRGPADLRGKRVGIPQWSQTANVYVRGYLAHDVGVPLESIEWVQAGVDEPGRKDSVQFDLPAGIRLAGVPDRSLGEMLLAGELDAVISARAPTVFLNGTPGIRRLFADPRAEEERYFRATGIFPIMHVIVLRRDAYEKNRWIARNLYRAFEAAKRASLEQLCDATTSNLPTAWGADHIRRTNAMLFPQGEAWPYGVEPNRRTLEAFLSYCFEQGLTNRLLAAEELFARELNFEIRI